MNTLAKTTPNQLTKATEALKKFKYDVPTEIREDEAHLNHVIVAQATPNAKTMEFDTVAQLVMLNDESLAVVKSQLPKYGAVVMLHDGKQYKEEKAQADKEAKEKAEADKKAEDEAKKQAEDDKEKQLKAKADEIENLKKQLASKAKAETPKAEAPKVEEGKAEEAPKKANGKG